MKKSGWRIRPTNVTQDLIHRLTAKMVYWQLKKNLTSPQINKNLMNNPNLQKNQLGLSLFQASSNIWKQNIFLTNTSYRMSHRQSSQRRQATPMDLLTIQLRIQSIEMENPKICLLEIPRAMMTAISPKNNANRCSRAYFC